jgi:hypothetical protein
LARDLEFKETWRETWSLKRLGERLGERFPEFNDGEIGSKRLSHLLFSARFNNFFISIPVQPSIVFSTPFLQWAQSVYISFSAAAADPISFPSPFQREVQYLFHILSSARFQLLFHLLFNATFKTLQNAFGMFMYQVNGHAIPCRQLPVLAPLPQSYLPASLQIQCEPNPNPMQSNPMLL